MARPLRIEYPGAMYHVMARGNQGRAIFAEPKVNWCGLAIADWPRPNLSNRMLTPGTCFNVALRKGIHMSMTASLMPWHFFFPSVWKNIISRKRLDQFLAGLPQLWRSGEARPTHRKEEPKARHWRTRADPFKNVWTDILLWLQKEPDCTAKVMLQRLDDKYPGQFCGKLLRTLQRRIGEWPRSMARRLVLGGVKEWNDMQAVAADAPLAGQAALRLAPLASAQPAPQGEQVSEAVVSGI